MLDAIETKDNTNIEATFMARALWWKNEGLSSVAGTEMSFRLSTQMVEEGKATSAPPAQSYDVCPLYWVVSCVSCVVCVIL